MIPGIPRPAESAPVVNAGADQVLVNSLEIELDGTVTDAYAPAGGYTTTWTKVSGPGTVTFDDASAVDTDATVSVIGVYVLRLTATDGVVTASDDLTAAFGLGSSSFTQFWPSDFQPYLDTNGFARPDTRAFAPAQIP